MKKYAKIQSGFRNCGNLALKFEYLVKVVTGKLCLVNLKLKAACKRVDKHEQKKI